MMRLLGVASYVLNNGPGSFITRRDESRSESELSQVLRTRVLTAPKSCGNNPKGVDLYLCRLKRG